MTRYVRQNLIEPRRVPDTAIPAMLRWRELWFPTPAMGALSLLLLALLIVFGWRFLRPEEREGSAPSCGAKAEGGAEGS